MLSLYGMYLIVAIGFAGLLVFRAVGPQKYKSFFDKWLWTQGEE